VRYSLFAAAALLICSGGAHAGAVFNVTITRIEAEPQGHFFVYLSQPITNGPSCVSQPQQGFVVDGTTAGGKVVISLLQTAYALGKTLSAGGNNACDVHGGWETIGDVYTTN
jgi:hypothetical protein